MTTFLLISSLVSDNIIKKYFTESELTGQQANKFYRLVADGIIKNGYSVEGLSYISLSLPKLSNAPFKQTINTDKVGDIPIEYMPIYQNKFISRIMKCVKSFSYTYKFCKKNKSAKIICDPFSISLSLGAILAAKIKKRTIIGLVTDLPTIYAGDAGKKAGVQAYASEFITGMVDYFICLSQGLNEKLNKKKKPYTILEGFADIKMIEKENTLDRKFTKRIVMYTGAIRKTDGVLELAQAFNEANIPNAELHIYGTGSAINQLKILCSNFENVKYKGVVHNNKIVDLQQKATLLVEPRLTSYEYTKYCFPSKLIEYIASGTAVLSTSFSSLPNEYRDHIFVFKDDTIESMKKDLSNVMSKSDAELNAFGNLARMWVIKNKNNKLLMGKVLKELDNHFV